MQRPLGIISKTDVSAGMYPATMAKRRPHGLHAMSWTLPSFLSGTGPFSCGLSAKRMNRLLSP